MLARFRSHGSFYKEFTFGVRMNPLEEVAPSWVPPIEVWRHENLPPSDPYYEDPYYPDPYAKM
jgi:hypothetical protein